jgi:hypothetical protein
MKVTVTIADDEGVVHALEYPGLRAGDYVALYDHESMIARLVLLHPELDKIVFRVQIDQDTE